jgi:thiamine-phosphate pyrophosphorylase
MLYRAAPDRKGGPLSLIEAAMAGGVNMVQLRARNASADDIGLFAVAMRLRELTAGRARFIVTGDLVLAEKCHADGVLITESSYRPSEARSFLRGSVQGDGVRTVGVFARSVTSAGRAERGGADYIQVGPVFEKDSREAGLKLLRKVKDAVQIPVIAFGGIRTPEQVADCLRAGGDGVAVTDAIAAATDPQSAAVCLRIAADAAWRALYGPPVL